jgi:protein phosphatase
MGLKKAIGRVKEKLLHQAEAPAFEVAVRCDQGKVREENQDRAATSYTPLGALFLVADGVGGLQSGALAAQMAADGYAKSLGAVDRDLDPALALQQATQVVNDAILSEGQNQPMASTVALLLLRPTNAYVGHAGDSRVYLVRDGQLTRLTRDHSIVQKMVDHGIITEAQSRTHPDASVLTSSLGQAGVELEISESTWLAGDAFLLCSDGLWGYVSEEALSEAACLPGRTVDEIADGLLTLALDAGGADNISIVFVRLAIAS